MSRAYIPPPVPPLEDAVTTTATNWNQSGASIDFAIDSALCTLNAINCPDVTNTERSTSPSSDSKDDGMNSMKIELSLPPVPVNFQYTQNATTLSMSASRTHPNGYLNHNVPNAMAKDSRMKSEVKPDIKWEHLAPRNARKSSKLKSRMKSTPNSKIFECHICLKKFNRKSNMKQHLKTHSAVCEHVCPHCGRGFKQKHSLLDHIRTHTGERPFKCSFCPKAFKTKHNAKTHMRLHTGETPYHCTKCSRKFISKSSLNSHVRTKHLEK